jgi:predicted nucleic acid-binding protein
MGALSVYLDTSVLVPLFVDDVFSTQAEALVARHRAELVVADFAVAEFASALGVRCRMKTLKIAQARDAFADFDEWKKKMRSAAIDTLDVTAAETILRRLDLTLRTPDAIHIAISQRLVAELATFDTRLADGAKALGAKLAMV